MYTCYICKNTYDHTTVPPSSPDSTHLICTECNEELEYLKEQGAYYDEDSTWWDEEELKLARSLI